MKFSHILAALAMTASAQFAFAIPANPGKVHHLVQPDGTVVEAVVIGDEFGHYYATPDRFPIVRNADGVYCYANFAEDGSVISSDVVVRNKNVRSASEKAYLSGMPVKAISAKILENATEKRNSVNSQRRANKPAFAPAVPEDGYSNPSWQLGLFDALCPHDGVRHNLVILVEFSDVNFTVNDPKSYYNDYFNKEGFDEYGATGSIRDYFVDSSTGQYLPTFDVYGPFVLSKTQQYYGENGGPSNSDKRAEEMIVDACKIADSEVDFSLYDTDGNGYVDNVYVIYAGEGEAKSNDPNTIWPHQYNLSKIGMGTNCDGVTIDHYACSNELDYGVPCGIGTICHEFSHVLGLPDLYDTREFTYVTPGYWSVLDLGPYLNEGHTPPVYSAFERNAMGWIKPEPLTDPESVELLPLNTTNTARIINTDRPEEFFLIENRQKSGWDTYLPGHGMLVWRIKYDAAVWQSKKVNNDEERQYVDLIEAGDTTCYDDLEVLAGYSFPGNKGVTELTGFGTPVFKSFDCDPMDCTLTEIAESDNGLITFNFNGGVFDLDTPAVRLVDTTPGGFTLEWEAVDNAKEYYVTVARVLPEADEVVPAYNDLCLGNTTTFVAERLLGDATYRVTLYARTGSNYSANTEALVATKPAEFAYLVPQALDAGEVGSQAFAANWLALEGAVSYLLDVDLSVKLSGEVVEMSLIDPLGKRGLPTGWESSENQFFTEDDTKPVFGKAAPAIKMTKNDSYVQTCVYDHDVLSVSAWVRQVGNSTANGLVLEGRADESSEWTELGVHTPVTSAAEGEIAVFDNIPEGYYQLRFKFMRPKTGHLAVDDIFITLSKEEFQPFIVEKQLSDVTYYNVSDIPSGTHFARYMVKAVNAAGQQTLWSDPVIVALDGMGGIGTVVSNPSDKAIVTVIGNTATVTTLPGARVDVYDVAGRVVSTAVTAADGTASITLPQGFYIICGQKVIVK